MGDVLPAGSLEFSAKDLPSLFVCVDMKQALLLKLYNTSPLTLETHFSHNIIHIFRLK